MNSERNTLSGSPQSIIDTMTNSDTMSMVYADTMTDLRSVIEVKFGSMSACAAAAGLDRFNLSRLFSKENPREMSIGTFVSLCNVLGLAKADAFPIDMFRSKISLKQYLEIDNNAVFKNIMLIRFL